MFRDVASWITYQWWRLSERDIKKNHILELYGIPLVRLSTIGSNEKKIIGDKLSEVLNLH